MKISITVSALILAAAMAVGWKIDGRRDAARTDQSKLAAEAKRFGISVGGAYPTRSTKRERVDREAEARQLTAEYIQLNKLTENGGWLDEATQEAYIKCSARISALDVSSLKILITAVLVSRELEEKTRNERVAQLLGMALANKDPRATLEFAKEHSAALKDTKGVEYLISYSLGTWAKDDPQAAVEWMKNNAAEFPDAMKAQSLYNVLRSAAQKEPRLAFSLIAELELDYANTHHAMHAIVTAAETDEQRNITLAALREYRDTHKSAKEISRAAEQMVGYFSQGFKKDGFDAANKWIAGANLTPKELDQLCGELSRNYRGEEHARWIEWMGATFPPGKCNQPIMDMIRCWTSQDYEAAGKWLASAPEGPARNTAIRGYAETVSLYDPETATQWAMTLPPGKDRDATLSNIHADWPQDDPAGKEAFATERGIK